MDNYFSDWCIINKYLFVLCLLILYKFKWDAYQTGKLASYFKSLKD